MGFEKAQIPFLVKETKYISQKHSPEAENQGKCLRKTLGTFILCFQNEVKKVICKQQRRPFENSPTMLCTVLSGKCIRYFQNTFLWLPIRNSIRTPFPHIHFQNILTFYDTWRSGFFSCENVVLNGHRFTSLTMQCSFREKNICKCESDMEILPGICM